jgi:hypothetical protein
LKRNYLSTISTRYNPDLIIGSALGEAKTNFIRGDQYFMDTAKKAKVTDEREQESKEDGEFSEPEAQAEDSEESAFENLRKIKG